MLVRSKDVVAAVCAGGGTKTIAYRAIAASWVIPALKRNRFVAYSNNAAAIILGRLEKGEFPPASTSKGKAKEGQSNAN